MGGNKSTKAGKVLSINKIAKEIIVDQVKQWHKKGLSSTKLSVKYIFLNRIGATN